MYLTAHAYKNGFGIDLIFVMFLIENLNILAQTCKTALLDLICRIIIRNCERNQVMIRQVLYVECREVYEK
jgi:hypothetical protein